MGLVMSTPEGVRTDPDFVRNKPQSSTVFVLMVADQSMHCPNCGNESSVEQKFCRKCGFNLEPVGKLFGISAGADDQKVERAERERQVIRRMVSWMMWGLLVMLIGVVLTVITKQFKLDQLLHLLSSFLILGGLAGATYGLLDAMRGGKGPREPKAIERGNDATVTPSAEFKADTTRELEGRIPIPIPSVTERTTQLIGEE